MFEYTPGKIHAVEAAISSERMAPYLAQAGGDNERALRLYERNTQLSEALYGPLQAVEIAIRNSFNSQLVKSFGPQWFDVLEKQNRLEFEQVKKLHRVRGYVRERGKAKTPGRIVAELSFGFWTAICAKPYMKLWIECLSRPFKGLFVSRAAFFQRLDTFANCAIEWRTTSRSWNATWRATSLRSSRRLDGSAVRPPNGLKQRAAFQSGLPRRFRPSHKPCPFFGMFHFGNE